MAGVVLKDKKVQKLLKDLIKNQKDITDRNRAFIGIMSAVILKDILDHFEKQLGPSGSWKPWSNKYRKRMIALGKGGNKILQDTGRMRQGWQPTNIRTTKAGILWYNPVKYSGFHDSGTRDIPQRQFTWLSSRAIREIESQVAEFMLREN